MKRFRCGDVVPGCSATFAGTEDEILEQVAEHARHDHGMNDLPAGLAGRVRTAMVDA